jgi:hypothetical protein
MTTRDMAYCCSMTEAIRLSSNAAITPALTKLAAQGILKSLIAKGASPPPVPGFALMYENRMARRDSYPIPHSLRSIST